jgi:hypothetical protein
MFRKKSSDSASAGRSRQTARSQNSAPVFSYHASRSVRPNATVRNEQPVITAASTQRRNTQRKWFKRAPVIVGAIILLVYIGLNLPVSGNPKIVPAKDTKGGIFLRPAATYYETTQRLLGGSLLNTNKVTINTDRLEQQLQAEFPELAEVTISLPLIGTRPLVYLEPATPTLMLTTAGVEVFVLDQDGRALITAAQVPGLSKLGLPVVKDDSGLPVKLGGTVLPRSQVAFITEVVGQLKAKQLTVDSMSLPAGLSELDVKVKDVPYFVKFNLMGSAREETGAYLATKQYLEQQRKIPGSYVDVRVPDRAYYR